MTMHNLKGKKMKKFSWCLFLAVLLTSMGCMPRITTGVLVDNQNPPASDNSLIRVWVLSEQEIQDPPTTRAEAEAIYNLVTYSFNLYEFLEEPGTYFIVASNETHFQGLNATDAFEPGIDFALLQVEVPVEGKLNIGVANTETPTLLPEIVEL